MNDSQILSAFPDASAQPPPPRRALLFDACQVGVVLRAVLFVETVMAVGAMFGAASIEGWLLRVSVLSARRLARHAGLADRGLQPQEAAGAGWRLRRSSCSASLLGAVAGLYGCGLLALMVDSPVRCPGWPRAFAGALLSAALVAALVLRAKGRMPADTTARLSELQARIRPHFLFNTLNSAIALVREDPARAEAMLEDLSDLFRHALVDPGESVTLAEEVELARRYLDIEQVRFGERLRVEWALDPAAGGARVPPLLLQPLVENAVKHGVEPSAEGAQVKISTQRRGSMVVIKVTNTVPARARAGRGHGVAQDNVRDRLRLLHDVQGAVPDGAEGRHLPGAHGGAGVKRGKVIP